MPIRATPILGSISTLSLSFNVRARPGPISKPWPLIMNAGQSDAGLNFAVNNAEYLFRGIQHLDGAKLDIANVLAQSKSLGRDVGIFTNATVVCRPTEKEAWDYHHYYAVDHADDGAVERIFTGRGIKDNPNLSDEVKASIRTRIAGGNGAWPIIGTPDQVADQMKALNELGFSGIAMGLVNYIEHFPYVRDEVLPRLEAMGLREKVG